MIYSNIIQPLRGSDLRLYIAWIYASMVMSLLQQYVDRTVGSCKYSEYICITELRAILRSSVFLNFKTFLTSVCRHEKFTHFPCKLWFDSVFLIYKILVLVMNQETKVGF